MQRSILDIVGAPFRSIHGRLLTLALSLVVVSGLAFAALTFSTARAGLERAIGRQLADKARETAELLSADLHAAETALRTLVGQDLMRELQIGDIDKRVSNALLASKAASPAFLDLVCSNAAGELVAATNPEHLGRPPPLTLPASDDLEHVSFSGPMPLRPGGPPVLQVGASVRSPDDRSRSAGSCVLLYDWRATDALARRMRDSLAEVGEQVEILLFDGAGGVIGGSGSDGAGERRRARFGTLPWRTQTLRGFRHDPDIGALLGYASLDVGGQPWTVMAVQPDREAFRPIAEMQRRWAWTLAIILVVAATTTILVARRIVQPLLALTAATRSLARQGERPEAIPVESADEVGELAASFNAMTARLEQAQEELRNAAKFAFVGEVAAGVAHEIRTPLGVLKTSAQVLQGRLSDARQRQELTEMMLEEVNRLDRVVAGLLELARPRQPDPAHARVDRIARRALEFLQPQARAGGTALIYEQQGDGFDAWCDSDQIYQVLLNLIMNALQALTGGGTVRVRVHGAADGVAIDVADDGPGIDPRLLDKIFTPFFTMREGGTGLGLALVDRTVRAHRGRVTVDSRPGAGTTFTVHLPAAEEGRR